MKIFLLRHAPTLDNEKNINGSQTDTPLSKKGVEIAQHIVNELANNKYDVIYVSPLQRTIQTIQPYLETIENPNVIVSVLTIERDLGDLTNTVGQSMIIKSQEEQGVDEIKWVPPNGESILDVKGRAEKFADVLQQNNTHQSILICSHQIFLRNLEFVLTNRPIEDFYTDHPPLLKNGELREISI